MIDRESFNVRLATEADAEVLPAVERSAGQLFRRIPGLAWIADDDVKSVEQHRSYARAGMSWVVVNAAERAFGFLAAERIDTYLHIWELAVHQNYQGRGAGRALLEAAFNYAEIHGLSAITHTTYREVAWNEPLYRHMGFKTLLVEDLSARLAAVLAMERENGLPGERRCAMQFDL